MPAKYIQRNPSQVNDLERAYLAGVIDSDGCALVYYVKTRDCYRARLEVCQANLGDLETLQDIWGGRIQKQGNVYHLIWEGQYALPVLHALQGFSKFKPEQLHLVTVFLELCSPGSGYAATPETRKLQEAIYQKLRQLKEDKYRKEIVFDKKIEEQANVLALRWKNGI